MTLLRLLHMTQLLMKAINLVAQFVQIVIKILQDYILDVTWQFIDYLGVENFKTIYNNKEIALEIRCYIIEYIQSHNKVFANIKQAEAMIAGAKSQLCMSGLKMVGYVCNIKRRHPDAAKMIKILD